MEHKNLRVYTSLQQICLDSQNSDFPTEGILVETGSHFWFFTRIHDSFEFTELTDEEKEKVMCNAELDR